MDKEVITFLEVVYCGGGSRRDDLDKDEDDSHHHKDLACIRETLCRWTSCHEHQIDAIDSLAIRADI